MTDKHISTLISDIYSLVGQTGGWFTNEISDKLGGDVSRRLYNHFQDEKASSLRLSRLGPTCPKALWGSIHAPGEAEPLPPWVKIKLGYGHFIEAYAIALAKAAGHSVTGEQDELVVDGVLGHRDCVIDGCVVDVKSTTSIGFQKFKDGSLHQNDSFGYCDQLDGYMVGSRFDPLVTVKDKGYILAIDKNLGHMVLYEHKARFQHIIQRIADYKQIIDLNEPPACRCGLSPYGESGNIALDVRASYSAFKYFCHPKLRCFLYSKGPVYLTHVAKLPKNSFGPIPEIDRHGNRIFHS